MPRKKIGPKTPVALSFDGLDTVLPFSVGLDNAGKLLGVSRDTVSRLVQNNQIPGSYKVGTRILISTRALYDWVQEQSNYTPANKNSK